MITLALAFVLTFAVVLAIGSWIASLHPSRPWMDRFILTLYALGFALLIVSAFLE